MELSPQYPISKVSIYVNSAVMYCDTIIDRVFPVHNQRIFLHKQV